MCVGGGGGRWGALHSAQADAIVSPAVFIYTNTNCWIFSKSAKRDRIHLKDAPQISNVVYFSLNVLPRLYWIQIHYCMLWLSNFAVSGENQIEVLGTFNLVQLVHLPDCGGRSGVSSCLSIGRLVLLYIRGLCCRNSKEISLLCNACIIRTHTSA